MAQAPTEQLTAQAATDTVMRFATAMRTADAATLEAVLAPDFTYTHRNARVEPRAELIPSVQGGRHYPRMDMEDISVREYPGTAIVAGTVHMAVDGANGRIEWTSSFTAVLVAIDGEWRVVTYQGTARPDA